MKTINIPVGKILAIGTSLAGIGISEYLSRLIKKSDNGKHSMATTITQAIACSAIETSFIGYASLLWNADHLKTTVNIMETGDHNMKCNEEFNDIIHEFELDNYDERETVDALCEVCRKYHQKVSTITMVEMIHKLFLNDDLAALICEENDYFCSLLVTLHKPATMKTKLYDGLETPSEACKMINAMYKLHALAGEINEAEDVQKYVADRLINQYPSMQAIREACQSCELMVANRAPWVHEGSLIPWLTRVTQNRHCMDVALSLAALAVNTPRNTSLEVAGITYYSALTANPKGFYYFIESFPTLAKDLHLMIAPKYPANSSTLSVVVEKYEDLIDENRYDVRYNIAVASAAALIIYNSNPSKETYDDIIAGFTKANHELAAKFNIAASVELLRIIADKELEARGIK